MSRRADILPPNQTPSATFRNVDNFSPGQEYRSSKFKEGRTDWKVIQWQIEQLLMEGGLRQDEVYYRPGSTVIRCALDGTATEDMGCRPRRWQGFTREARQTRDRVTRYFRAFREAPENDVRNAHHAVLTAPGCNFPLSELRERHGRQRQSVIRRAKRLLRRFAPDAELVLISGQPRRKPDGSVYLHFHATIINIDLAELWEFQRAFRRDGRRSDPDAVTGWEAWTDFGRAVALDSADETRPSAHLDPDAENPETLLNYMVGFDGEIYGDDAEDQDASRAGAAVAVALGGAQATRRDPGGWCRPEELAELYRQTKGVAYTTALGSFRAYVGGLKEQGLMVVWRDPADRAAGVRVVRRDPAMFVRREKARLKGGAAFHIVRFVEHDFGDGVFRPAVEIETAANNVDRITMADVKKLYVMQAPSKISTAIRQLTSSRKPSSSRNPIREPRPPPSERREIVLPAFLKWQPRSTKQSPKQR